MKLLTCMFILLFQFISPQDAENSMKFYRGIKTNGILPADEEENAVLMEKLNFEFEGIKSLINEQGIEKTEVVLADFCEHQQLKWNQKKKLIEPFL